VNAIGRVADEVVPDDCEGACGGIRACDDGKDAIGDNVTQRWFPFAVFVCLRVIEFFCVRKSGLGDDAVEL
jgi:hypothetical protein